MIHLSNIRPTPLLEMHNGISQTSGVFGTTCEFEKGKNYLITARSGKGKSTLMHIIYGLRTDFQGQLLINNTDATQMNAEDWANLRQNQLSIVFQDLRLFPTLSVLENLFIKANLTDSIRSEEINDMVERLEMTPFIHQTAETLSYGQRQRIAIIRALCQPFSMLLLDEPFSHLDQKNIELATDLIHEKLLKHHAGVILASLDDGYGYEFDFQLEI